MKFKPGMFSFAGTALLAAIGLIGPVAPSAAANDKQGQDGYPNAREYTCRRYNRQ